MSKLNNLKALMSNSRTRVIFIVTMVVLVVAFVVAFSFFSRDAQTGSSSLSAPPEVTATVGGFDHATTPQYAKLQQEQNTAQAQHALQTGGTAIPTIIQAQDMNGPPGTIIAPPVASTTAACTPMNVNATNAGPQAVGTVCADGTVRDANGRIVGHTGAVVPGGIVYGKDGKVLGTVGPDGKVRDANGKIIGEISADGTVRDANGNIIGTATTPVDKGDQTGTLVYDKNGHVLGTIGPDGKLRDANGHVLGTVGPDGLVRDANGNIIGTAGAGAKTGGLAYDKDGNLLGVVGADGLIRDAKGNVVGSVGPDGVVKDLNGKVIGSTSLLNPKVGGQVYDKNGKLIGIIGPDGKVRDANGNVIGTMGPDGIVRDANGNIIGSAVALPKSGTLVYDKNGKVIGTVGADGKVRDANGNVIGTVGPDGVVRDANGAIVGQASTPAPGTAVTDAQGKLLGVIGADGLVRDANGKIIGTVGADGLVRDASGNVIGKTNYIAAGSPVFGPDGKLMGTIGPDGRLIPANATAGGRNNANPYSTAGLTDPKQINQMQQAQLANTQKQQQLQSLLQGAMSGQVSQLISAWAPPTQSVVVGSNANKDTGHFTAKGWVSDPKSGSDSNSSSTKVMIKTGSITFGILNTAINSDEPGPILATITEGKLKGGKMIGSLQLQGKKVMLTFSQINIPSVDSTQKLNVIAIDPNTARTAIASDVDNHYLSRYGAMFASSFLQSYAQAVTTAGSQTTYTQDGVVHTYPTMDSQQKMIVALGGVGTAYSGVIAQNVNRPATVTVDAGTSIGVLFLSDMNTPPGMEDSD